VNAQTTLELGAETSTLVCIEDGRVVLQHSLPLGTASLARQWMRHTPPTPLDMEHAIEQTEDVVMPLAAKLVRTDQLLLRGSGAALILQAVGAKPDEALLWGLDEVEVFFNRIAMVSQGRPSGQEALPTAPEFYAAMVILRECLHHLRFGAVVVEAW
jgi:exopolyphosphatase/pppGpp-phosphohydrolase